MYMYTAVEMLLSRFTITKGALLSVEQVHFKEFALVKLL